MSKNRDTRNTSTEPFMTAELNTPKTEEVPMPNLDTMSADPSKIESTEAPRATEMISRSRVGFGLSLERAKDAAYNLRRAAMDMRQMNDGGILADTMSEAMKCVCAKVVPMAIRDSLAV